MQQTYAHHFYYCAPLYTCLSMYVYLSYQLFGRLCAWSTNNPVGHIKLATTAPYVGYCMPHPTCHIPHATFHFRTFACNVTKITWTHTVPLPVFVAMVCLLWSTLFLFYLLVYVLVWVCVCLCVSDSIKYRLIYVLAQLVWQHTLPFAAVVAAISHTHSTQVYITAIKQPLACKIFVICGSQNKLAGIKLSKPAPPMCSDKDLIFCVIILKIEYR